MIRKQMWLKFDDVPCKLVQLQYGIRWMDHHLKFILKNDVTPLTMYCNVLDLFFLSFILVFIGV